MANVRAGDAYAGGPPRNYERYFVPVIGAPAADGLLRAAALRPGERVLDVACGTGIVARLAAESVGTAGAVAGLDVNAGMLAVAREAAPAGAPIDWREASAEQMPYDDGSFDVVLCQMGLQFVTDRTAALSEMRRVLAPGGRVVLSVAGPTPEVFVVMAEALGRHVGPEAAGFVHKVFSLHDARQLGRMLEEAGFVDAHVREDTKTLRLPAPAAFLWQYVHSTPMSAIVSQVDQPRRDALERDVVAGWRSFVEDGALILAVRMLVASGKR